MKFILKKIKYIALALSCFLLIIACSNNPNNSNISTPNNNNNNNNSAKITIGTTLKPRTLDPADSYDTAGLNIIYNVAESLYTYKVGTTELTPLLATAMPEISEDGLTYKIPLREGVTFHDGSAFNAEAMKFSLDRFITNAGKPSFLLSDTIKEIKATGEYELTITLNKPFAAFTALLAFPGACAISPQAYEIGEGKFNPNSLIGTGAYQLQEFNSDSIRLATFPNYWGEKPVNQGVDVQIYAGNSANLYNSFLTSAIDVAYQSFAPEQITDLLQKVKDSQIQAIEGDGTVVSYMVLNRNQKPLDKLEVRQAIAALMNRQLIIERVLQGQSQPAYTMIPTVFDVSKPVFQEKYQDNNITLAKELLTKAGFSPTNPAVVEVWYPSASKTRSGVASTLKALAEKELEGMIQFVPNAVESATAFSNLGKGIYPSFLADWYPDFLDADNYVQPFLDCTQGSVAQGCTDGGSQTQGSFFYSEKMNDLIDLERKSINQESRSQAFAEIQEILAEEVPYIPLWQNTDYAFAQNGVKGINLNPSQNFAFSTISK